MPEEDGDDDRTGAEQSRRIAELKAQLEALDVKNDTVTDTVAVDGGSKEENS